MATERKWGKVIKQRGNKGDPRRQLSVPMIKRICGYVCAGHFRKNAFALEGIPDRTWRHWLTKGKEEVAKVDKGELDFKDRTLYYDVYTRLIEAEGKASHELLTALTNATAPIEYRFKLYQVLNKKLFAPGATSMDNETGDETTTNPLESLEDRISYLLGREDK